MNGKDGGRGISGKDGGRGSGRNGDDGGCGRNCGSGREETAVLVDVENCRRQRWPSKRVELSFP